MMKIIMIVCHYFHYYISICFGNEKSRYELYITGQKKIILILKKTKRKKKIKQLIYIKIIFLKIVSKCFVVQKLIFVYSEKGEESC